MASICWRGLSSKATEYGTITTSLTTLKLTMIFYRPSGIPGSTSRSFATCVSKERTFTARRASICWPPICLPCRYLDSYTWPVPPAGKRVVKHGDITYYYASRPVDDPFVATVSQDGKWIAATFTRETGNVWTNPELTCQHADPETSLKARGTASLEGKTFVFMGTLEQFLEKIRKE